MQEINKGRGMNLLTPGRRFCAWLSGGRYVEPFLKFLGLVKYMQIKELLNL